MKRKAEMILRRRGQASSGLRAAVLALRDFVVRVFSAWRAFALRRELQIDPFYANLFQSLDAAVRGRRRRVYADFVSLPNLARIIVHPLDFEGFFKGDLDVLDRGLRADVERLRRRYGYAASESLVIRWEIADLEQIEVRPGQPVVEAERVADPSDLAHVTPTAIAVTTVDGASVRTLRTTPAAGASTTVPGRRQAGETEPLPATVLRPHKIVPTTAIVELRFTDGRGAHVEPLYAPGWFGRADPDSDTDVEVQDHMGAGIEVVSRRALWFDVDERTGWARVANRGRVHLVANSDGAEQRLAPLGVLLLVPNGITVLRWPSATGGSGFTLDVRAPIDGMVELRAGEKLQSIVLRRPRTHIVADRILLGCPERVAMMVELDTEGEALTVTADSNTVPVGEHGQPPPAAGTRLVVGRDAVLSAGSMSLRFQLAVG